MELNPRDTALLIRITHSKPIEISAFAAAVNAVNGFFRRFRGLSLNVGENTGTIYNCCTFNFYGCGLEKDLREREDVVKVYDRQLMTIFQMRGDMSTDTGNRSVIDALGKTPFPVVFANDDLKYRILSDDSNPTKQAYLVDVVIQTIGGKPAAYKVMALHDIVPLDD